MLNSLGLKLWVYAFLLAGYCDLAQNILAILGILFVWMAVGVGEWIRAPAEGTPWGSIWMLAIKKGGSWLQPSFLWAVSQGCHRAQGGTLYISSDKVEIAMEGNTGSWPPRGVWSPLAALRVYLSVTPTATVINHFSLSLFTGCPHQWPTCQPIAWQARLPSDNEDNPPPHFPECSRLSPFLGNFALSLPVKKKTLFISVLELKAFKKRYNQLPPSKEKDQERFFQPVIENWQLGSVSERPWCPAAFAEPAVEEKLGSEAQEGQRHGLFLPLCRPPPCTCWGRSMLGNYQRPRLGFPQLTQELPCHWPSRGGCSRVESRETSCQLTRFSRADRMHPQVAGRSPEVSESSWDTFNHYCVLSCGGICMIPARKVLKPLCEVIP